MTNVNTVATEEQTTTNETVAKPKAHDVTVLNIIEAQNGFARVVIDSATFNKVRGREPVLPFETVRDNQKRLMRKFVLNNTTLFSRIDVDEEGKLQNIFVIPEKDANELVVSENETLNFSF